MKVKLIRGGRYASSVAFSGVDELTKLFSNCSYKHVEIGNFLFIDFKDRIMVVNKKTEEILHFIEKTGGRWRIITTIMKVFLS